MEERKSPLAPATAAVYALLLISAMATYPAMACSSSGGSQCRKCILDRFKQDCPPCVPILQCMARCLWGSAPRGGCVKKCDCGAGQYPRLSDCKKCVSRCKCSCLA
ncbi:hypothetical protein U1Q18_010998 [Sarracenia purpurea var. burkii]